MELDDPISNLTSKFKTLIIIITIITKSQSQPTDDNILIAQQDLRALQSLKLALSDPRHSLRSWNSSSSTTTLAAACSSWHGIRCARGHVIAISLPSLSLSGLLPDSPLSALPFLRKLSLHHNSLRGPLPPSLFSLPRLRGLHLSNNLFAGPLPIPIPPAGPACVLLQALDLGNNRINGSIPGGIARFPKLRTLDLSANDLAGEVPGSLDRLADLVYFNVSYNGLSGPVSAVLARRFASSSFIGNRDLCGYAPAVPCITVLQSEEAENRTVVDVKIVVLIAAGIAIAVLFVVCLVLLYCLLRRRRSLSEKGSEGGKSVSEEKAEVRESGGKLVHLDGSGVTFTAESLLCATAEILGKSTYGTVYRARLEDGSRVAVKRLREKFTRNSKEFEAEAKVIGKVRHENLLELRAYYMGPKGEKLLVYDFMPNGNLAAFLHGKFNFPIFEFRVILLIIGVAARGPETFIDWRTRARIATSVARGLSYLHGTMNVLHGNLTTNNILLLDDGTNPKVSDFGLYRLMAPAANSNAVAAAAAMGYRAPELHNMRKVSGKTDVYSFGVVLLELLTGRSPAMNNGMELAQWAASVVEEEWTGEVFDPEIMRDGGGGGEELVSALKIALRCTDLSPAKRPEIGEVVEELEEMVGGGGGGGGREVGESSMSRGGES